MNCDCSACTKEAHCHRTLRPSIKITDICTQQCAHCCFECSPKNTNCMTHAVARKINKFLHANKITRINISGGEFICHPNWRQILAALSEDIFSVRLVSNSDWAIEEKTRTDVLEFLETHSNFKVALSCDRWHTNKGVRIAARSLQEEGIPFQIQTTEEAKDESIVPVGRSSGRYISTFYSLIARYCDKPDRRYEFLINEEGNIYKCVYGLWEYTDVFHYLKGGFAKRFKEFSEIFYNQGITNCAMCNRIQDVAITQERARRLIGLNH